MTQTDRCIELFEKSQSGHQYLTAILCEGKERKATTRVTLHERTDKLSETEIDGCYD